jgi:nucleotide-binding universal stress UspA family protein
LPRENKKSSSKKGGSVNLAGISAADADIPAANVKNIIVDEIVLATDYSEASLAAVPFVRAVASRFNADVHVVNVVDSGLFPQLPLAEREKALHESQQVMRGFLESCQACGPRWKPLVEGGDPAEVLLRIGKELAADLLVLGTSGRRGFERFVLGSVAEEIFRLVPCPVLTIGPNTRGKIPQEVRLENILFATDLTSSSLQALPCALNLARLYHAPMTVLHVVHSAAEVGKAKLRLKKLVPQESLGELETALEPKVETGAPAKAILRTATAMNSDLIVLGVRHGGSWDRLATHAPGPIAYNVIAQASCPVLTLRAI